MKLEEFDSVRRMLGELKLLTRSRNTELTYLKSLKSFFEFCGACDPDELVERVRRGEEDASKLVRDYAIEIASKDLAPKSVATWVAGVKKFFSANGIRVETPAIKTYTLHEDTLPSREELRKVLEASSLKARVCILLLSSSGMRVSELIQLRLGDVDLSSHPPIVRIRGAGAKERKARVTFISTQAKDELLAYLERRGKKEEMTEESFLVATSKGGRMTYQNVHYIISNAFKRVAKKVGKRYTLHPHLLRKWFKTQMISAGVPGPIVDRLVGHKRYLSDEYELYTEEQLKSWYLKGMQNLIL